MAMSYKQNLNENSIKKTIIDKGLEEKLAAVLTLFGSTASFPLPPQQLEP